MTDPTDPSGLDSAAQGPAQDQPDPSAFSTRNAEQTEQTEKTETPEATAGTEEVHGQDAHATAQTPAKSAGSRAGFRAKGSWSNRSNFRKRFQPAPAGPSVVARYGLMRYVGEFTHQLSVPLLPGRKIVVRTDRGVEMAEIVAPVEREATEQCGPRVLLGDKLTEFLKTAGPDFPFRRTGKVLRLANQQDEVDFRHLESSAREEIKYCRSRIKEKNLQMKVVTAEHLLGGGRIIYYFTAEKRVDFRDLVRDLASQFRTRIEMRQVGARDEARLVGDYERCGQMCCCRGFLKMLQPVSMRMAKVQKATLDPAKISGRCGRLMCCLRYEDKAYSVLRKNLPNRNTWLRTKDYLGKVADVQIITQLVRLLLSDGTSVAVGVDEIVERDMKLPTEEQLREATAKHAA
ncbi:MAG: hypothetical protein DRP83_06140, partial [Planctomycetota bacterium]